MAASTIYSTPNDFWIQKGAIRFELNALGDPDKVSVSLAAGAVIMAWKNGVIDYNAGHNYRAWALSAAPTHFDKQDKVYVYVRLSRLGDAAQIVYPYEKTPIEPTDDGDYYIMLGALTSSLNGGQTINRQWATGEELNTGVLDTDQQRREEGSEELAKMFVLSNNVIWAQQDFSFILGKRLLLLRMRVLGDNNSNAEITHIATSNSIPDSGEFEGDDTSLITTAALERYANIVLGKKYFRKDQPDTSPHLATFGDVHVAAGLPNGEDTTSDGNLNVDNDATILGDILGKKNATIDGILKALAQILSNRIESDNWSGDGTFDSGFRLQKAADGITSLVVDNLFVRMKAIFNELETRKISYAGGNIIFSHAGSKVVYVSKIYEGDIEYQDYIIVLDDNALLNGRGIFGIDGSYEEGGIYLEGAHLEPNPVPPPPESKVIAYRCYLMKDDGTTATENWWRVDDHARCQTFNVVEPGTYQNAENTFYWRRVIATGSQKLSDGKTYDYVDLSREDRWHSESFDSDIPQAGDQIVQMGNRTDAERQGFISIEVYGEDAPAFKVYRNINGYTLEGKRKICISPKVTEIRAQKFITETEYDVCRVPQQRSTPWYEGMQCYYYDLLQHNGSTWLCTYPEEGVGGVKYTTEEPSETATYWSVYAQKGPQGESGLTPRIVDGYWWIGDTSTGIKAEGDDGLTPYIGANGNWWIGTTDTGVQAEAQSALHIDLSNQMDGVAMESDGKVSAQEVLETDVALYYGTQKMGLTSLTYSTLPTGVTASINPATGHVTITVAKDTTFTNDKLDITFTATCQKGTMAVVFTIQGFRAGADGTSPVIYQLVPSEVAMKKDKTGTYTPATLTCSVTKRDGNNAPVPYTGSDVTIRMSIDGGSEQPYASITTNTTKPTLRVTYKLYQGTTLIDVETVHVTEDGIDGESPYFADIDNEMDSVACDPSGVVASAQTVSTTVYLYKGSTKLSSPTIKVYDDTTSGHQYTSGTAYNGITITWSNSTGAVSVAFGTTVTINGKKTFCIQLSKDDGGSTVTREVYFTVNGIKAANDGSPAVIYNLMPSAAQISAGRDGTAYVPSTFNLTCGYVKNTGGAMTSVADVTERIDSKYNIYYRKRKRSDGLWFTYYYLYQTYKAHSSATYSLTPLNLSSYDAVEFILCTANSGTFKVADIGSYTVIDKETVPVVADGLDGDAAVVYELFPSSDTVVKNADGTVVQPSDGLSCTVKKIVGGTYSTPATSEYTLKYTVDDGTTESNYQVLSASALGYINKNVKYLLYDTNSALLAKKTVTFVKYGNNGANGTNGVDAVNVSLSSQSVIFRQSETQDSSGGYPIIFENNNNKTNILITQGDSPIAITSATVTLTASHCNATRSGNVVTINSIQTYSEGGKSYYYENGYVDVAVTYSGVTYTERFNFYCNLLGTWKTEVEGDTQTAIASAVDYLYDDSNPNQVVKNSTYGTFVRSSTQNISDLQRTTQDAQGNYISSSSLKQTVDSISLKVSTSDSSNLLKDPIFAVNQPFGTPNSASGISSTILRYKNTGGTNDYHSPWEGDGGWLVIWTVTANTATSNTSISCSEDLTKMPRVKLVAGKKYTFSVWVAGMNLSTNLTSSSVLMRCVMYSTETGGSSSIYSVGINNKVGTAGEFTQYAVTFTCPTSYTYMRLQPYMTVVAGKKNFSVIYAGMKLELGETATRMGDISKSGLISTGIDIENRKITVTADQFECQNNSGVKTAWLDNLGNFTVTGVYNNLITIIDCNNNIGNELIIDQTVNGTKTYYIDALRCGDYVWIKSLPKYGVAYQLPYYVDSGNYTRGWTRFLTGVKHQMSADEMRQLTGRRISIKIDDNLDNWGTTIDGAFHFQPYPTNDVGLQVKNVANGQHYFYVPIVNNVADLYNYRRSTHLVPQIFHIECVSATFSKNGTSPNFHSYGYVWLAESSVPTTHQEEGIDNAWSDE